MNMNRTIRNVVMGAAASLAFAATAAERVELLDVHQEETNRCILSYTYLTQELSPAMTYQLVTAVKVSSGLPGARKWQFKAYTNDVTEANAIVTASINLENDFGPDLNPDGGVNLSLIGADSKPVGTIFDFAGPTNSIPRGYLLCDGAEYSTNDYARLYAVIGSTFGSASDGCFKVPDFRGRVSISADTSYVLASTGGEATHVMTVQEMPSHLHNYYNQNKSGSVSISYSQTLSNYNGKGSPGYYPSTYKSPSTMPTGGSQPMSLMQPYMAVNKIIKY